MFYAGDNDLAKGKTPEQVAKDFESFVKTIHAKVPDAKIVYIGIKPSLKRWNLVETIRKANRLIEAESRKDDRLAFVDLFPAMLGEIGQPRSGIVRQGRPAPERSGL